MEQHTHHLRKYGWSAIPAAFFLALTPLGAAHAMRENPDVSLPADPPVAAAPALVFSIAVEQMLDDAHAHNVHTTLADLRR